MAREYGFTIEGAEVGELRISQGEIGFVLLCPNDAQNGSDLKKLMDVAESDEFVFSVSFKTMVED